jgi:hypothetical protein
MIAIATLFEVCVVVVIHRHEFVRLFGNESHPRIYLYKKDALTHYDALPPGPDPASPNLALTCAAMLSAAAPSAQAPTGMMLAMVCDGVWCGGVRWFMVVYGVVHTHTVRGGGTPRMSCNREAKRPTRKSYMQGLDLSSSDGDAYDTAVAPSPPVPAGMMVCFGVRWCMVWWCAMVHGGVWCCSYTHSARYRHCKQRQ